MKTSPTHAHAPPVAAEEGSASRLLDPRSNALSPFLTAGLSLHGGNPPDMPYLYGFPASQQSEFATPGSAGSGTTGLVLQTGQPVGLLLLAATTRGANPLPGLVDAPLNSYRRPLEQLEQFNPQTRTRGISTFRPRQPLFLPLPLAGSDTSDFDSFLKRDLVFPNPELTFDLAAAAAAAGHQASDASGALAPETRAVPKPDANGASDEPSPRPRAELRFLFGLFGSLSNFFADGRGSGSSPTDDGYSRPRMLLVFRDWLPLVGPRPGTAAAADPPTSRPTAEAPSITIPSVGPTPTTARPQTLAALKEDIFSLSRERKTSSSVSDDPGEDPRLLQPRQRLLLRLLSGLYRRRALALLPKSMQLMTDTEPMDPLAVSKSPVSVASASGGAGTKRPADESAGTSTAKRLVPASELRFTEDGRPLLGATKIDQLMLVIQARAAGNAAPIMRTADGQLLDDGLLVPQPDALVGGIEKPKLQLEKPHVCSFCQKRFTQSTHLEVHVRSHIGLKPFECRYCHKRFTQGGNLRTHERLHTGEKPFKCELCGRNFSRKGNLVAHMLTHNNARPFSCRLDGCEKLFTQLGNLKAHQNRFHQQTLNELTRQLADLGGDLQSLPPDERELLEHFRQLYKNSNRGIRGRGRRKPVEVTEGAGLVAALAPAPTKPSARSAPPDVGAQSKPAGDGTAYAPYNYYDGFGY